MPFDLALSHEEKWLNPDPKKCSKQASSAKYTNKLYCVQCRCVMGRFPDKKYQEIPDVVKIKLREGQKTLIKEELDHSC